jgi:hypothetical protein
MRRAALSVFGLVVAAAIVAVTERAAYSHKPITTPIMFNKEIAQIFQRKCFQCHSENNLAVSFTTYEAARPWARAIREEVLDRKMPPWGAVTGFGHFVNDVSLTAREMDIILSWADGGAPSGVLKAQENIAPVDVPSAPLWEIGQPDEVVEIEQPFTVKPGSGDSVRRVELRAKSPSPRALRAIAFKPGDRRIVRYAAISETGTGRWLWTWTPWHTSFTLPADVVYRLPARAALTSEIGYRAGEEAIADKSEVGLYFSDARTAQDAAPLAISGVPVTIAAGTTAQRVRAEMVVSAPRRGLAIWPELGEGIKSVEIAAISPDGVNEPLLWVKDVRRDWPTPYVLQEPVSLARGTRLVVTTYYENATDKPRTVKAAAAIVTAREAAAKSTTRESRNLERKRNR